MSNFISRDKPGTYWITGCAHAPWHNKGMYNAVYNYISKEVKLQGIILAGDIADMNSLSAHDRGKIALPGVTLDWEYKGVNKFLDEVDSLGCRVTDWLSGNHEHRFSRAMKDVDTAKLGEALLSPVEGLNLVKRKYNVLTDWQNDSVKLGGHLDICHGEFYNVHSAKKTIDTYRKSTMYFHCFSEDVELLTKEGWKKGIDLPKDTLIATMNKSNRELEWNKINGTCIHTDYKELYHIKSDNIDLMVTDGHGLIFDKNGRLAEKSAKELYDEPEVNAKFIVGLKNDRPDYDISDLDIKMLINIVTDGFYSNTKGVNLSISFRYKKQRKVDNLVDILKQLDINYNYTEYEDGVKYIYITHNEISKYLDLIGDVKKLPSFFRHLSVRQANLVLEEYAITDGNKNKDATKSYQITSSKEEEIDVLQELFAMSGFRSSKIRRPSNNFCLTVNTRCLTEVKTKNVISKVPYEGKVWCVNVDNGTLLVRSKGKTVVTLNTHRFQIYMEGMVAGWNMGAGADFTAPIFNYATRAMRTSWVNASALVTLDKEGFYHVEPLIYINNKLIVNGRKY